MEESIVTSYNYSGTCIIYWRIKIFIFVPRQATRKKVIQNKPIFCRNIFPRSGETTQIWGAPDCYNCLYSTYNFLYLIGAALVAPVPVVLESAACSRRVVVEGALLVRHHFFAFFIIINLQRTAPTSPAPP